MRVVRVVVTQISINLSRGTSLYRISTEMNTGVQLTSTMIGDGILSDMCSNLVCCIDRR